MSTFGRNLTILTNSLNQMKGKTKINQLVLEVIKVHKYHQIEIMLDDNTVAVNKSIWIPQKYVKLFELKFQRLKV